MSKQATTKEEWEALCAKWDKEWEEFVASIKDE